MGNIFVIIAFVAYALVILGIGIFSYKKSKSMNDYFIGGRQLGSWTTAISAQASDMSGWLLMGLPGLAYLTGIASPGWTAIGLAVGTWLNWLIVARRLRRYSANLDAITVPQFLSLRFHDQRNLLNALGAVIIIVFFKIGRAHV